MYIQKEYILLKIQGPTPTNSTNSLTGSLFLFVFPSQLACSVAMTGKIKDFCHCTVCLPNSKAE